MPNTTNYNWVTPSDSDLVKDGAAAIRTLGSSIDSTLKTQIDAQIPDSLLTTKGDLIAATGASTPARLGVGANDTVLMADSTAATGIKWGTVASGGMTLISETVASGLTSLSLSSIPSTYKQIFLIWSGIYHSATGSSFGLRINNSTDAAAYPQQGVRFQDSVATTYFFASSIVGTTQFGAFGTNANNTADPYNTVTGSLLIDNYASTTKAKYFEGQYGGLNNTTTNLHLANFRGRFDSTAAITSLDIYRASGTGNFSNQANTSIRLYGIS